MSALSEIAEAIEAEIKATPAPAPVKVDEQSAETITENDNAPADIAEHIDEKVEESEV